MTKPTKAHVTGSIALTLESYVNPFSFIASRAVFGVALALYLGCGDLDQTALGVPARQDPASEPFDPSGGGPGVLPDVGSAAPPGAGPTVTPDGAAASAHGNAPAGDGGVNDPQAGNVGKQPSGGSGGVGGSPSTEPADTGTGGCCSEPEKPSQVELEPGGLDHRPNAAALTLPPTLEIAAPGWIAVDAFPALTFDDPVSFNEAFGTDHIFVTEREGRVYAFENYPEVTEKHLVLDLSHITQGENDSGLLGLVFHPEFGTPSSPNRAFVYLHYALTPTPIVGSTPDPLTPTVSRLARFTVDLDTLEIDPASELVLIDQEDESIWHQGGAMFFDPIDGFLYLGIGDEGSYRCEFGNCQRIDKDLFSGVLRIDVDMRGGDISHPIPKQPASGETANYYIPNDNPFVGQPGVLEEFYALGLRSPHRMTYDPIDDIVWIGEVGEIQHEELNVLRPAANFQWNVLEGLATPGTMSMPADPLGIWTGPVLEFTRQEAASIIGGYVYRGARLPNLYGKYVFADFVKGSIWALSYAYDGTTATALNRELLVTTPFRNRTNGITSFGVDLNDELYILTLGAEAKIFRLDRTGGFSNAPQRLSETGVFRDTSSLELEPSAGLIPYDVRSALWSDGARKRRWISVPDGETVGFSETGSWSFPQGTVFVKHFEMAFDESYPDETHRLETRLLVRDANDGYYGLTYKWNEAGTDADLLAESHTEPLDVILADGQNRELQYFYPGPSDCDVCHNSEAGAVLGVRTHQLNSEINYPQTGRVSNQLVTWGQAGILDVALNEEAVSGFAQLASLTDENASPEARVRSYWASNCSMCHGSVSGLRADWDARFEVPLDEQGVIWGASQSAASSDAVLVFPGDPEESVLYQRSATTDPGFGMPPLGRSAPDPAYVALLSEWIQSLDVEKGPAE